MRAWKYKINCIKTLSSKMKQERETKKMEESSQELLIKL